MGATTLSEPDARARFFIGAEAGLYIYSVSFDDAGQGPTTSVSGSTEFGLQPMAGVSLGQIEIYAQYSLASFNFFGLSAMFVLPVGGN